MTPLVIRSVDIAPMLIKLREAQRTVTFYEGARFHEERFKQYGARLGDMANLVRDGLQMPIPMPVTNALPLGLQLTANHGQDARLLRTAVKLERLLIGQ